MSGEFNAQQYALMSRLVPGSQLAGYVIEEQVGAGGMAVVFRARDAVLGRLAALKILSPALSADSEFRTRFLGESRAVASVEEPHIIPVYGAGEVDGVLYIATKFVSGGDLADVLQRAGGPLEPARAAAFIEQVAAALDAAHAAGLVHRDVKPGNILVDARRGEPEYAYLTDFGIARAMMSAGTLTLAGQFLGTPDYAAPEQINGQPVDGRADQYALACVAYEVLSGAVPFRRDSAWSVLYAHLNEPPPRIPSGPGLPPAVSEVLAKGMAKSPASRYPTCGDFGDALREALGLDPYDPSRTTPPTTVTHALPLTRLDTPTSPETVDPGNGSRPAGTWTAVVTADRDYYESLSPLDDEDSASISFPSDLPERRIPLAGAVVRIGRRSASRGIEPEIDLGQPRDPGVSRQHAKLVPAADGGWTVVDLGTENGITVNGHDVPSGESVPLRPGDRIHLGAWTRITITRG